MSISGIVNSVTTAQVMVGNLLCHGIENAETNLELETA